MPLSDQQVGQYRRDGYVCPVPVMSAGEALGLRKDFDPVAVAFHAQAAKAMREVLYAGAEKNLQRL